MDWKNWEINGISLPLDLEDVAVMERYEAAFTKMNDEEKALPKDGKRSEMLRAYCTMYRNLYDGIFGEGTADKIFGESMNARIYDEIYGKFLDFVAEQITEANRIRAERVRNYHPGKNKRKK